MIHAIRGHTAWRVGLIFSLLLMLAACNLGSPQQSSEETITPLPTMSVAATRTLQADTGVTVFPSLTPIPFSTQPSIIRQNTPFVVFPARPTNTPVPISIVIVSPLPGNVVAGNVQVVGSAIHPSFLQYRLEYGPDPNPNNLWYSITGIVNTPVLAGTLGVWSTNNGTTPDGTYQLRLRVFLRDGSQQTTQVGNIRVRNQQPTPIPTNTTVPAPIAAFTQDTVQGFAPLVVRFTNRSQGQISSYTWNFGDGGTSNQVHPAYTYRTPGVYTVTLRVTGPGGTANVSRQINVQSATTPRAAFTTNTSSGQAPLTVNFTSSSTGQINSYLWDFGDGSESTQQNPSHVFNDVGTYNVILRVTGPGGSDATVGQITVTNPAIPAPQANFEPSVTSGETPLTVVFSNTSTGEVTTYLWDVNGDGITDSTDESPTYVYNTAGTYSVRLIAIGPGGQSTAIRQITVQDPPDAPNAAFSFSPETGTAPLTVQFTNETTGNATGYVWDFNNDGQPDSTQASPQHTYQEPGTYTITLVANGPGGSTNIQTTISVQPPPQPPTADFIASPATGQAPLTVQFTNQSQGSQLTFAWDFQSNGSVDSTEQNPSYIYETAGTYTVTLTVTSPEGLSDTSTETIQVSAEVVQVPPTAAFTFNPQSGRAPLRVTFVNQTTGDVTGYAWDFNNDGQADSTQTSPTHEFTSEGTYTVTLTATGPGGSNSISSNVVVSAALTAPVAAFTANPTSGTAPLTVTFTNTSTGEISSYSWDFNGDGTPDSNQQNPIFTYETAGTFNATLTVTNEAGSDSISVPIQVNEAVVAPVAAFTANPTSGTAPLTVTFTNTSTGEVDSYSWDFNGDGTPDSNEQSPTFTYETAGTYNATLTVTNEAGSDTISVPIQVSEAVVAPVAAFTANPTSGTAPLTVTFTNTSTGDIDSYSWDFNGDGMPDSNEQSPTFTYETAGTFNATLTVENEAGSNTATAAITVDESAPPPPSITGDVVMVSNRDGNNELYVINADNSWVNLTNNPASDTQPVWSPDGNQIAFVSDRDGNNEIYVLDISDLTVTRLTNDNGNDQQPSWSPDGNQIAFISDRFGDNDIFVMNADGSNQVQRTTDTTNDRYPVWSPDGRQLAFVSDAAGNDDIYIINSADGSGLIPVTTDTSSDSMPDWSSDDVIVFVSNRAGDNNIYTINPDGTGELQLTTANSNDAFPRWSLDGNEILFSSNLATDGSGNIADFNIYTMNPDGSGQTPLTTESSNEVFPTKR